MLGGEFLNKRENKKWMLNLLLSVTLLSLNQVFSSLSKNTYEVSVLEIFKISSTSAIIMFMGLFTSEENFDIWIGGIKSWSRLRKIIWLVTLITLSLLNYFIFDKFLVPSLNTVDLFIYESGLLRNAYILLVNIPQYLTLLWNGLILWIEIASSSLLISLPINFIIAFSYDWIEKNFLNIDND